MKTLEVYGYVGDDIDGVTDRTFAAAMKEVDADEPLHVLVNSGGGSVFQGLTIYQSLVSHEGSVTIEVRGVAGSIASVIAMAGDKIEMHQSSRFMIHNAMGPSSLAFGNSDDLREAAEDTLKTAELLDEISSTVADVYQARTGADRKEIVSMMDAETWIDAAAGLRHGFADSVIESKSLAARCITKPRTDQIANIDELKAIADLCGSLKLRTPRKASAAALRLAKAQLAHLSN